MARVLKVSFNDDIRRFAGPVSYANILEQARGAWPQEVTAGALLKYCDDEGDLCTLTADTIEDFLALHPAGDACSQLLRLELVAASVTPSVSNLAAGAAGIQFEDAILELPAIKKLLSGQNLNLEAEEVKSLCEWLNPDEEGKVKLEVLRQLLMSKLDPQPTEKQITDLLMPAIYHSGADEEAKFEDCVVTPADIHSALTSAALTHGPPEEKPEINRDLLTYSVVNITDRHGAFTTLPIATIYMLVLVALVVSHLRIWDRQYTEKTLEEWVNGRDPRTDCEHNVDGMEAFWEWLLGEEDGIRGAMAILRSSPENSAWPQYVLANRNILVGDVLLERETFDGEPEKEWLMTSDFGQEKLKEGADFKTAAWHAAAHLQQDGWDDPQTRCMTVSLTTYNEKSRMFGITAIRTTFLETGAARAKISSEVVSVEPYPTGVEYLWEALFVCIVGCMTWTGGKDVLRALRLGSDEFKDYWEFWNCVDWMCIVFGVMLICTWLACISAMDNDSLNAILDQDRLNCDVRSLGRSQSVQVMEAVESIQVRFRWLHFIIAANAVGVASKFLKGFTSNPRLEVVTDTAARAGTDLVHLIVMFFALYLPFTIIGHVLFGNDIDDFGSIASSFKTGLAVLMGDFDWYVDASASAAEGEASSMPSGMPMMVLSLWLALDMFLVFLGLVILLCIIMKHHTTVDEKLLHEPYAPPIWTQVKEYIRFRKRTRNHVKLEHMRRMLLNDDDPAHETEGFEVTADSLMSAFTGMTEEQANYEMDVLRDVFEKMPRVEEWVRAAQDEREEQRKLLAEASSKLDKLSDAVLNAKPADKGLLNILDRMQRDQKQLVRRIDKISSRMGLSASSKDSLSASDMREEAMRQQRDERKAEGKDERRGRRDEEDLDDRRREPGKAAESGRKKDREGSVAGKHRKA